MRPPTEWYLAIAASLFTIGVVGVLARRNAIVIFMSIELMLNAVNLTLVAYADSFGASDAHAFVFFVMAVAAAEAAVGLAIILAIFRRRHSTSVDDINLMKW